ncbi:MAG: thiol peroxidase [Rikenellaceae bacterium]
MINTTFKGTAVKLGGTFPKVGDKAKDFTLVKSDLSEIKLSDLHGKRVVLNIFPSLDTGVCATSVRKFNEKAASMPNTVVLAISKDLPFASGRFCAAEGIKDVITASAFRNHTFATDYGVDLLDSPLKGLLARAVIVIDHNGVITHTQLVSEITTEPDYSKV